MKGRVIARDLTKYVRVVVTDGRVAVRGAGLDAILTNRMLGIIDDSGRVSVTPNINIDDYSALTSGRLVK